MPSDDNNKKPTVSSNSRVVVKYIDHRGDRQKRIALSSLAAFILNSVNQPARNRLAEETEDK